jgi:hypothetical protein
MFKTHAQVSLSMYTTEYYILTFECEEKAIYLLCESQVCIKEGFDSANVFPVIPKQIRLLRPKNND